MKPGANSYPISIRFTGEAKANLEREAKQERRSVSFIVREIIQQHYERKQRRGAA